MGTANLGPGRGIDSVPPFLHLDIVVPVDVVKMCHLLRILLLDEAEKAPSAYAEDGARALRAQTVPDVRQDEASAAEDPLNVDG